MTQPCPQVLPPGPSPVGTRALGKVPADLRAGVQGPPGALTWAQLHPSGCPSVLSVSLNSFLTLFSTSTRKAQLDHILVVVTN